MIKIIIPLAIILLCGLVSKSESYRLPTNLRPQRYKLEILTHLSDKDGYKFYGKEWIRVICDEDTKSLVLHTTNLTILQKDVKISEVVENSVSEKSLPYLKSEIKTDDEFYIYNVTETMVAGKEYDIFIPFEGDLNTGLFGYYRSSYFDLKDQKDKWIATTQFEPTSARRAFPCFDEPEMKAKFEITMGHHKSLTAISNMPIKLTEAIKGHPDYVWDHFEESVPMSTYLVAYIVHDFDYKESVAKMTSDVPFKIWARRDAVEQVEYAKVIGPKCLSFYEEYFDEKYPLPKMDMIAIPDFSAGAMENWGLITYRETALLFKPNVSTASSQHRVAEVVAHELAHQWFGNLVTMKWWTDLWLNEGFATYVASLGVSELHPEWNTLEEETVDNTRAILGFDALKSSHPVSVPIGHPSEIEEIFDAISYEKGSNIIRMMHLFLGEDAFRFGVSKYLKKHKYGNAEQNDLWESLTEEAHKRDTLPKTITVNQIMDSWTVQTGYPIITVNRDYEKGTADVTQIRYLSDTNRSEKDLKDCWWIPLSYTTEKELDFNSTKPKDWSKCDSDKKSSTVTIKNLPDDKTWVLFNIKLSGLYKVKYDEKNWNLLIDELNGPNYEKIHKMNRAQLIDDVLDLAWSGDQEFSIALRLIEYLKQEKEYIPWKAALANLNKMNTVLKKTSKYGNFKKYMQALLTPIYEKTNGLNDVNVDQLDAIKHKSLIAVYACRFNVGDCVEQSKNIFEEWMAVEKPDEVNTVPLDLRSVIYCTAIRHGDENQWDFLWQRYLNSNVGTEKVLILGALACTREVWILNNYLDYSLDSKSGIKSQDSTIAFASIANSEIGFYLAKDFFFKKIDKIAAYHESDLSKMKRYITPLTRQMSSYEEIAELKKFFEENKKHFTKVGKAISQGLEYIEINSQFKTKNSHGIIEYLSKYDKKN